MSTRQLGQLVTEYFSTIDASIEQLSLHEEGVLSKLPCWQMCHRFIKLGYYCRGRAFVVSVQPSHELEEDVVEIVELKTTEDMLQILAPWKTNFPLERLGSIAPLLMSGARCTPENPLAPPALDDQGFYGWGPLQFALETFSLKDARMTALSFWNSAKQGRQFEENVILAVRAVLAKCRALIKRKTFLERRIHRYLVANADILLPPHRRCLTEYKLLCNGEERYADIVLEREQSFPALLIELESPTHRVFTKKGDLTKEANHAIGQVAEWVAFIDSNPGENAADDMGFLVGPKERLVVIGRGREQRERLLATKFRETKIWTYEVLIEQARERWNKAINEQCRLIGLDTRDPF